MARSRKFLTVGALSVAAIALIGAGAGATFNQSTASGQTITAGTIDVVLTSPDAPGCTDVSQHCTSLSFPEVAPVASTFETTSHRVTITNVGNIPVLETEMNLSDRNNGQPEDLALRAQMNVCVKSSDSPSNDLWVVANGPLRTGESLHPSVGMNLTPVDALALAANGGTDFYDVTFYAGQNSACGTKISDGSHTASSWWLKSGNYKMPASLTNAAMGGVVTPTMTFSYTG